MPQASPDDSVPLFYTPAASVSLRQPVADAFEEWRSFMTAGCALTVPSTIRNLYCYIALEAGNITARNLPVTVQVFSIDMGIKANLLRFGGNAGVSPVAGLSSMMVGGSGGGIMLSPSYLFKEVENEFGFFAGVAPWYRWKMFDAEFSFTAVRILSSPERFTTTAAALRIGYRIDR